MLSPACCVRQWADKREERSELETHGWPGYPDDDDLLNDLDLDEAAAGPAPPPPSNPPTSPQVSPNISPVTKEDKKRPVEEGPARESPEEKKPRIEPPKVEEKAVKLEEDAVKREEGVEEVKEENTFELRRSKRVSGAYSCCTPLFSDIDTLTSFRIARSEAEEVRRGFVDGVSGGAGEIAWT